MGNSNETFNKKSTAQEVSEGVDLTGKVCIVTGSSSGIGLETARVLALRGARIIMACRNMEKADKVRAHILATLKKTNKDYNDDLITVLKLDLSSLLSVRQFVNSFTKLDEQINYLVCNAGIMMPADFTPSVDGFEIQFATNHLGHFYLTYLLTPILLKTENVARVIVLASSYHSSAPKLVGTTNFILDGINNKSGPSSKSAYSMKGNKEYGLSKICNALFAMEYNRRYQETGIVSVSIHPGVVNTDLGRHTGAAGAVFYTLGSVFMKTIPQGAATTVRCVTMKDEEIEGGHYYKDCQEANASLRKDIRPIVPKPKPKPKAPKKEEKKEEKKEKKDEKVEKKDDDDDDANANNPTEANADDKDKNDDKVEKQEPEKDEPPKEQADKDESKPNDDEATKEKEKESDKEAEKPKENENEEVKKDDANDANDSKDADADVAADNKKEETKEEVKEEVKEEKIDEVAEKQKRIESSYGYKLWEWSELLITEKGFALNMNNFEAEEKFRIEEEERLRKEKEEKEAEEARLKQEELEKKQQEEEEKKQKEEAEKKQKEETEKKAKEDDEKKENKENDENDENKVSDDKNENDNAESKPNENDATEPEKAAEPEPEPAKQDESQPDATNEEEPVVAADPVSQ